MTRHQRYNIIKSYKEEQKEQEELTFPMSVEEANEELSFRSRGKEIENEGTVSITLRFANIEDMMSFRDDLIPKAGIRAKDALDDNAVATGREFIAQMNVEEGLRLTRHITTEG